MSHRNLAIFSSLALAAALCFICTSRAAAQYERKNVRYGVSFDLPINTNEASPINCDLEAFNTMYGNFCVKVFPLKDFYGKDKTVMQWAERYSRNRKMWKSLDTTAKTVLKQLTVLDNLNPVHGVNTSFKKIGRYEAYSITFMKTTDAGQYSGECIGIIIHDKSLFVKAIHYMPEEYFDEEAQKIRNHFFESLKVR